MKEFKCEIICIGTEILLGDIVNTNSHFITKSLAEIGVNVYYHTVVGDNFDRITKALDNAFDRGMNLVITTGGLGPTDDDLTKKATSNYFNLELILNQSVAENIQKLLNCKREDITQANLKQAYVPQNSKILSNDIGTAPGIIIEHEGKVVINLPGPPNELYKMFNIHVKPYLENKTNSKYYSEFVRLYGIDEGKINHILSDLFSSKSPTFAPYVGKDDLVLRITTKCLDDFEGQKIIRPFKEEVYKRVGEFIYAEGDVSIEELLFNELSKRGFKISFAESCTGGMVSSRFINFSGASQCFNQSFVTYSNESKIKFASVSKETLKEFGAVSFETAREMALGVSNNIGSEVSISTTGVAGPNKSEDKDPGLVYIGVNILGKVYVKELKLIGDRMRIRERATFEALAYCYSILRYI